MGRVRSCDPKSRVGQKTKSATTSVSIGKHLCPPFLRLQLHSLRDRIFDAGYEEEDIDFIGMYNVPTSNVDKVLTEDGASCDAS